MKAKVTRSSPDPLEDLLARLDFSPEAVVTAAAEQPILFLKAARYRVTRMRNRLQAAMQCEEVRADKAMALRSNARSSGERITEGAIAELLTVSPAVKNAQDVANTATEEEEFAKLLLEAFRHRRDCLKVIGDLTGAERAVRMLHEASTEKLQQSRRALEGKYPGKA